MVHIQKKKEVLRKKFAAAVTKTVESSELFQGNDSYIQVPHAVENLLHTKYSLNFSIRRLTFYEILFLFSVKLCILLCNSLNPTTLLHLPNKREIYNCVELVPQNLTPRLGLQETHQPIQN